MWRIAQVTVLAIMVALPGTPRAAAQTGDEPPDPTNAEARYRACMALTQDRPKAAFDRATAWENLGGGHPARHCALAALVELGHYFEAAQGLEHLARRASGTTAFKTGLLIQAARAWIAADDAEHALGVMDTAMTLNAGAPDEDLVALLLTRGRARAAADAFWDAADDLSRVLYVQPQHVEALVLRGAAYRQLQAFDLALDDLNRALKRDPDHPEGLLERGIVHRLQGDKTKARADWRRLVAAHPSAPAAELAGENLHALDSGVE